MGKKLEGVSKRNILIGVNCMFENFTRRNHLDKPKYDLKYQLYTKCI